MLKVSTPAFTKIDFTGIAAMCFANGADTKQVYTACSSSNHPNDAIFCKMSSNNPHPRAGCPVASVA
jgi:hypothetical protein